MVAFLRRMFEGNVEISEVDADGAVAEKLKDCAEGLREGRVFEVRFL